MKNCGHGSFAGHLLLTNLPEGLKLLGCRVNYTRKATTLNEAIASTVQRSGFTAERALLDRYLQRQRKEPFIYATTQGGVAIQRLARSKGSCGIGSRPWGHHGNFSNFSKTVREQMYNELF